MTSTFAFSPSARLQRYLGAELIADPNVAIIEFIKNSYDAGASRVLVQFDIADEPARLVIADDGVGMDEASFDRNWMHPGFSEKGDGAPPAPPRRTSAAERRRAKRQPVGEKGLGRLAAGRLGARLEVFTRESPSDRWLHVDFVWARFDDMTIPLDRVRIPFDYDTPPPSDVPFTSGTAVVIHGLIQRWDQRVRGRAVHGRRTTRLGRLKQDLEFLLRPMTPTQQDFTISLVSDLVLNREDIGEITPGAAVADAYYSYSFQFTPDKAGRPVITRTVARSPEAAQQSARPQLDKPLRRAVTDEMAKAEGRPLELLCGPFGGTFLYNPPQLAQRAKEIDKSPVGVLLYRDGLLVEPYGVDENDWVGARARKAQRHGHAAISPDTFSGFVLISRRENGALRDMSNRLGLLDSPASENFIEHVRAEFFQFEQLVEDEIVVPRQQGGRAEEAQGKAEETQRLTAIKLRSLAHSVRQPLQGLAWDLVTLEALEGRADIPADARATLHEVRESVSNHIGRVEARIQELLSAPTPAFAEVKPDALVRQAVAQLHGVAQSREAELTIIDGIPSVDVLVPPDIVIHALASLIQNALEAGRPEGRAPTVEIRAALQNGDVVIEITDNGTGVEGFQTGTSLSEVPSTKGRPAAGLADAEIALTASRGALVLTRTDGSGTAFEVRLPTRVAGVSR